MAVTFLPPRQQICDPKTGISTREFWLFIQGLTDTSGTGAIAEIDAGQIAPLVNSDALTSGIQSLTLDIDNLSAGLGTLPADQAQFVTIDDLMPLISGLRDEIAGLRSQLLNIQQGAL